MRGWTAWPGPQRRSPTCGGSTSIPRSHPSTPHSAATRPSEPGAPRAVHRYDRRECCILSGREAPFDFQALRIHQPRRLLPDRAHYEIFNADRQLLATVTETEGHTRLTLLSKPLPDTRALAVTTAAGAPGGFLITQRTELTTECPGPAGELISRIRTGATRRSYTLLSDQDQTVGKVTGYLAL